MESDELPNVAAEKDSFQRSVAAPASHVPHSSSTFRFTSAQAGFFDLSQSGE